MKPGMLPVLALDRARALIAAGLFAAADEELAFAVEQFRWRGVRQDRAEALVARAEAALLAGDETAAARWASLARREFLRRDNRRWAASAALVALQARSLRPASAGARLALAAEAAELARTLHGLDLGDDSRKAATSPSGRCWPPAGSTPPSTRRAGTDPRGGRTGWRPSCSGG